MAVPKKMWLAHRERRSYEEEKMTGIETFQAIADTVEREKDKHGKDRDRLNLTIFLHDDGSVRIYTSQVGRAQEDVRAVEPVVHCSNRFEATGALAEILRMIEAR
jgi:polyribonucleotide nucleotidyltransferase